LILGFVRGRVNEPAVVVSVDCVSAGVILTKSAIRSRMVDEVEGPYELNRALLIARVRGHRLGTK
jgi:hypothetical protein